MARTNKLLCTLVVGCVALLSLPFVLRQLINYHVYHRVIPYSVRIIDENGNRVLVLDDHHIEDKGFTVQCTVWNGGLWPSSIIESGDRTYVFTSFGRVFVLARSGIHARSMVNGAWWFRPPEGFPFKEQSIPSHQEFLAKRQEYRAMLKRANLAPEPTPVSVSPAGQP